MTQELQREQYIHFESSIEDLNSAWRLLKAIKETPDNPLTGAAFQLAVVVYSRPYNKSMGHVRDHKLDQTHVPNEHLELHNRLIQVRNQIIAHSDLTIKDAVLHISDHPWGRFTGISQNNINGTDEFRNIDSMIQLIEGTLDSMYKTCEALKNQLPAPK